MRGCHAEAAERRRRTSVLAPVVAVNVVWRPGHRDSTDRSGGVIRGLTAYREAQRGGYRASRASRASCRMLSPRRQTGGSGPAGGESGVGATLAHRLRRSAGLTAAFGRGGRRSTNVRSRATEPAKSESNGTAIRRKSNYQVFDRRTTPPRWRAFVRLSNR